MAGVILALLIGVPAADSGPVGQIEKTIRSAGGDWTTLHTSSTYHVWSRAGEKDRWDEKFRMSFRMWAAKPDKLRVEITEASLPMLEGMTLVRSGGKMQAYDTLSMRTIRSDLERLFGGEMPGFDTSVTFITTLFDVDFAAAEYLGSETVDGRRAHHVRLVGKQTYTIVGEPGQRRDAYFDAQTLHPLRETVYDADGRRILAISYRQVRRVAAGRSAPTLIEIVNALGGKMTFHLEWVGACVLLPTRVEMISADGRAKTEFRHTYAWVNRDIPAAQFDRP
jgi:outer membrane lipoprotein-sorting protein